MSPTIRNRNTPNALIKAPASADKTTNSSNTVSAAGPSQTGRALQSAKVAALGVLGAVAALPTAAAAAVGAPAPGYFGSADRALQGEVRAGRLYPQEAALELIRKGCNLTLFSQAPTTALSSAGQLWNGAYVKVSDLTSAAGQCVAKLVSDTNAAKDSADQAESARQNVLLGAVAGGVVGGVLLFVGACYFTCWLCARRERPTLPRPRAQEMAAANPV